jgi:DNA-binding transcriptional LysR family regulator
MNHFEEMRIYAEVIKSRNFTKAASNLGISKQLVSRRLMELEARLGARLLHRTTRKLSPTELGKIFYERCLSILQSIEEAEQDVCNHSGELRGVLRISAPVSFASMRLSPCLNAFLFAHPKLSVLLDVDNRLVDIVGEGYDLAIRVTMHPDPGLIARKLADSPLIYCCSPDYIEKYGEPDSPLHLTDHRCISQTSSEWIFEKNSDTFKIPIQAILRSNHGEVMKNAAVAELGITGLPHFYVEEALKNGELVQILKEFTGGKGVVYALYPQHKQSSFAVRAFIDHLQAWFKVISWD